MGHFAPERNSCLVSKIVVSTNILGKTVQKKKSNQYFMVRLAEMCETHRKVYSNRIKKKFKYFLE